MSLSKEACKPAPVEDSHRQLLQTFPVELLSCHGAMLRAKHNKVVLARYLKLDLVPTGLASKQRPQLPNPPRWFTLEWEAIEKRVAIDKMRLLIRMWEEEALRQQGKCIKVKTDRVKTFRAVTSTEARDELLSELLKEEVVMAPKMEAMEAKQEKATQAFLRKLSNLSGSGRTAMVSKPGPSTEIKKEVSKPAPPTNDMLVGKDEKPTTSTYARIVKRKAQLPAKEVEKTTPLRASNTSSTTPTIAARRPPSAAAAEETQSMSATAMASAEPPKGYVVTNTSNRVQQKGNPSGCPQEQSGDCGDTAPEERLGHSPGAGCPEEEGQRGRKALTVSPPLLERATAKPSREDHSPHPPPEIFGGRNARRDLPGDIHNPTTLRNNGGRGAPPKEEERAKAREKGEEVEGKVNQPYPTRVEASQGPLEPQGPTVENSRRH